NSKCCGLIFAKYQKRLGVSRPPASANDFHSGGPGLRGRGLSGRADLRDRRQLPLVGQVEVDPAGRVAAVQGELPILGPEDVAVEPPVGIPEIALLEDLADDQIEKRPGIA